MAILSDVNMQSTGQGGPQVNRDLEVIFGAVKELIRSNNDHQTTLDAITGGANGSPSQGTGGTTEGEGTQAGLTSIVDEAPAVLAGSAELINTEDAWETISAGVPAGVEWVVIQGYMYSANDSAGGILSVRAASGQPEREIAILRADGVSDADRAPFTAWFPQKLTNGSFDYKADTTAGSVGWEVRRIGYLLFS